MTCREERWRVLAAELARMPGTAERLLAVHVDDGTGRCAVCSSGGQAGHYVWPCQLCLVASHAVLVTEHGHGASGVSVPGAAQPQQRPPSSAT